MKRWGTEWQTSALARLWLGHHAARLAGRAPGAILAARAAGAPPPAPERIAGYPENHTYRVRAGRLEPGFQLYARWRVLSRLYPAPLTSLLDVGCSRGYFVLEAAARAGCEHAVGVDVDAEAVAVARESAAHLGLDRARFEVRGPEALRADPESLGGPFQLVLVVNVYQYLFFGSRRDGAQAGAHEPLLAMLARMASDRVVLSSPLELEGCSTDVRRRAAESGCGASYTKAAFLAAARRDFEVEEHGRLGKRPLLVLRRR